MMLNRVSLLAVLTLFCVACAGDVGSAIPGPGGNSGMGGAGGNGGNAGNGGNQLPPNAVRRLMLIGDAEQFVQTGSELQLRVAYEANQTPIVGEPVNFRILDMNGTVAPSGVSGSVLRSASSVTDQSGVAQSRVSIGQVEAFFQVEASAPGSQPVRWRISVGDEGIGAFQVRVLYAANEGRYTYRDMEYAEVFLFEQRQNANSTTCRTLNPNQIFGAYRSVQRRPFDAVDNQVLLADLEDGQRFSVAAVAYNQENAMVAYGCLDDRVVAGGESTRFDLPLRDVPFEFKGRFRMRHTFDLTEALATSGNQSLERVGQVLRVLQILGDGSGNRGNELVNLFCEIANVNVLLCTTIRVVGSRAIDQMISNVIATEAPQVLDLLTAISDLVTILNQMTIIGEFEFLNSFPDNDGWLRGNEDRWQKFAFNWGDCPQGGNNCEQEFTIGEVHRDPDGRDRPIFSQFDAIVRGSDMEIKEHTLTVRYGLIILGLVENWVIPQVTDRPGPISLSEVLATLLPCEAIDCYFRDNQGRCDVGFCEDILVTGLTDVIVSVLSELQFNSDAFTVRGTVRPIDTDGDLIIDRLECGRWTGNIGGEADFSGCFEGCRDLNCEPEPCIINDPRCQ